jgi:hypothetical protein
MPAAIEWSKELQTSILQGIESGLTLRQVAKQNDISDSLILKHVREDEEFCKQYTRVLELRTDSDFEGLIDLVDEEPERGKFGIDPAWVNLQRMRVDTRKWALSKRNPKKYGERIQQEHTGADGGPLQIISSVPRPKTE